MMITPCDCLGLEYVIAPPPLLRGVGVAIFEEDLSGGGLPVGVTQVVCP